MEEENNQSCNSITFSRNLENNEHDDYTQATSSHLSVTTVLNNCKSKILNPYMRLLSFMGLRPLLSEQQEPYIFLRMLSYAYTFQVVGFMIIGYFLQYMSCFRRDRGFYHKMRSNNLYVGEDLKAIYEHTCDGSIIFSFAIPSVLHLLGYLYAVVIFRSSDDDQLPVLMERVFLSSTNLSNGFLCQKKLVRILWLFVTCGIIWIILSFTLVNYMMAEGEISFKWMENSSHPIVVIMKILLVVCTLWHDMVQATVISNYCIQAQLLTAYVQFLREKLLQQPIHPLEWIRDIENFKKLLGYLNNEIAPSVCLFTITNLSFTFSGILWIFNFDHIDRETLPIFGLSVLNALLWIFISISPFIQSARLSSSCNVLKTVGQEVRARPYVYQEIPVYELDSILIYTTSLKINAKLFCVPIQGKYLWLGITVIAIIILVLGQCHYLISK